MKGKEEIGYVGVLVAHLAEEEGDVPYKKIWVYIWPEAFIICPEFSSGVCACLSVCVI